MKQQLLLDILVEDGVDMEDKGGYWQGPCPFHEEDNASFTVYKNNHRYVCFGCGVKGDVIDYITSTRGWGIKRTLRFLGLSTDGVPIIKRKPGLIDIIIDQESEGVDVVAMYGDGMIRELLTAELERLAYEGDRQVEVDHEGRSEPHQEDGEIFT